MTYGEIMEQFCVTIQDQGNIIDWRPCEEMFGVPTIPGAIVIWLKDKSQVIYIPHD